MNGAIRRTALFLGLAFLTLFVNLNIIQAQKASDLADDPRNRRQIIREFGTRRGDILAADNTVLARSVDSGDERYRYVREYPEGDLYGHITGYYSFFYGSNSLERSYNDVLLGREPLRADTFIDELLGREPAGNTIRLTIEPKLQRLAMKAFDGQRGGAAVMDSSTGAILALFGNPGFDPNPLAGTPDEQARIQKAWERITSNPNQPLISNAFGQRYPPGSTFKVVVATAGLLSGMTPSTTFPDPSTLDLPDTDKNLANYQNGPCRGGSISMSTGLSVSCNTTFAQVAMRVGGGRLSKIASRFGLEGAPDIGIPVAPSCIVAIPGGGCGAAGQLDRPSTAYSGIGQKDVRMTPLAMAMVASGIGNGGFRVEPHLVERIFDPTGEVLARAKSKRSRIMPKATAKDMYDMMVGVVRFGTGAAAGFSNASSGTIGGKTGTAETGTGEPPHVWFIAFGPDVSVAVMVENGGYEGRDASGGRTAGPIARQLLEKALELQRAKEKNPRPRPDLPDAKPSFPTEPSPTES